MAIAQEKKVAHGITLTLGAVTIGQIIDITPPTLSISTDVDVTTLDSTFEQFLPSRPYNVGEITLNIIWTPGGDVDGIKSVDVRVHVDVALPIVG